MVDQNTQDQVSPAAQASPEDVDKNKAIAIIGYLLPILFFIPLVSDAKNSPFAKFHANQHLILLIGYVIVQVAANIIPFLGLALIMPLGMLALLVVAIMGLIGAANGQMKPMPVIGGITILK